jgi:hypothetical protein
LNIIENINYPELLGRVFPEDKTSYFAPFVMLKCLYGLKDMMTPEEQELAKKCLGGRDIPTQKAKEFYMVAGRRSLKSFSAALICVHEAFHTDFAQYASTGEKITCLIVAVDKLQALIIFKYISSIIEAIPLYEEQVELKRAMDIQLKNGVQILIRTSTMAGVRGYTYGLVLLEECSFWNVDGVNPDHEVLAAIRPGLASVPPSTLIALSSPYGRAGILYEAFRDYYGESHPEICVWSAPTTVMNPTIPQSVIDAAYEVERIAAKSEYGAVFRSDVETCFPLEWLESARVENRFELPPVPSQMYRAFMDPSGGAASAFTLSIGDREPDGVLVQDVLKSTVPPFSPQAVCKEYARKMKEYGVTEVVSDRWGGEWVIESMRLEGIKVIHSKQSKTELYLALEPILARGACEMLDNKTQFAQLRGLDRRRGRGGKDIISCQPRQHDDSANSLAGLMANLDYTFTDIKVFDLLEEVSKREITGSTCSKTG